MLVVVSYTCLIGVIMQTDLILIGKVVELLEVVGRSDIPCYFSLLTSHLTGRGGRGGGSIRRRGRGRGARCVSSPYRFAVVMHSPDYVEVNNNAKYYIHIHFIDPIDHCIPEDGISFSARISPAK